MQDRFLKSIANLPESLAKALVPILDKDFAGHIDAQQLDELRTATQMEEQALLLALLPIAAALAKPPISNFYVGAIAKGKSGDIYMGG
ncbi:MAG: cytidine deaminase, partial [Shewanella sp.]